MNRSAWWAVAVFGTVALVVFVTAAALFGGRWGYYGGWGMMGPGMMGPGMMGGWGFGPLGWIGGLFMWLIPIGLIVLTVMGVVWLVRVVSSGTANPSAPTRTCPSCGRGVQAEWRNCPHCGAALQSV